MISYQGLVSRRFHPVRPDRPPKQYVLTYNVCVYPSLVAFKLDDWMGWELGNELFGLWNDRNARAIHAPSDKIWRSADLEPYRGTLYF